MKHVPISCQVWIKTKRITRDIGKQGLSTHIDKLILKDIGSVYILTQDTGIAFVLT